MNPTHYTRNAEILTSEITNGKNAIDAAAQAIGVTLALNTAKGKIDLIKTDVQLAAEELATVKLNAKNALGNYVNAADYTTNTAALSTAIANGKGAIEAAIDEAGVTSALNAAKVVIDEIESDNQLAAKKALLDTLKYNNNNGTPSNWLSLEQIAVVNNVATADFEESVYADIKGIYNKVISDGKAYVKVADDYELYNSQTHVNETLYAKGADETYKELTQYSIDSYVMNTFARYLGAIGRGNEFKNSEGIYTTPVKTIEFNGVKYTWNGTLSGSNWKTGDNKTLVEAVVAASTDRAIRSVNLTLIDANDISVEVTFEAANVPTTIAD